MADVVEKIVRIEVEYKGAIERLGDYRKTLDAVKDAERELKIQRKEGKVSAEEYSKQMALLNQQQRATSAAYRSLTKEVQNNIKVEKQKEGSLASLRAQLSNTTKAFDNLSRAERNSATGRDLQAKINGLTTEIKNAETATQRFYRNVGNYQDAVKGINELTAGFKSLGGIIVGLLGGLGMEQFTQNMLNTARDFEDAIARVRAVANPLRGDFEALRDKAMELGRTTRYTASEVANGMEELARKGLKANDTLEAIFPTLQLAQANVVSIADAAQISASTMRAFGKEAKDLAHINDVLSAACANSAMTLNLVGEAMKTAGPVAAVANVSLEETTALIGGLANVGMTGSDAGTGIKQIVLALTNAITTKKGKTILDKYNLDIDEARIKTEGIIPILKEMKEAGLGESNAAMQKLVGKYAAPRLGNLVQNIDQVVELKNILDQSMGENQRMFEQSLGNTSQAIYEMTSAWQGFMIDVYDSTDKFILSPINAITSAIRFLANQITFVTTLLTSMFASALVLPALKKFRTSLSAPWQETKKAMVESRQDTIKTLQNNANAAKTYAEERKAAEIKAIQAVEREEAKLAQIRNRYASTPAVVWHKQIEAQKTAITKAEAAKRAATEERIAAQATAKIQAKRLAAETGFWGSAVAKAKMGWAAITTAGTVAGNAIKAVWSTVAPFLVMTAIMEAVQGVINYVNNLDALEKKLASVKEQADAAMHNQTITALTKYQEKLDASMKSVSGYERELKKLNETEAASIKDKGILTKQEKLQTELSKSSLAVKEYERQLKNIEEREAAGSKSDVLQKKHKNIQQALEKTRKAVDEYRQKLAKVEEAERANVKDQSVIEKKRKAQEGLNKAKEREAELLGDINGFMGTQITDSNEMNRTLLTRIQLLKKEAYIRANMDVYTEEMGKLTKLAAKYKLGAVDIEHPEKISEAMDRVEWNDEASWLSKGIGSLIAFGRGEMSQDKRWGKKVDIWFAEQFNKAGIGTRGKTAEAEEARNAATIMQNIMDQIGLDEILKRLNQESQLGTPSGDFQPEDPWSGNSKKAKNQLEEALKFLLNAIKKYKKELRGIEADSFFDEFAKAEMQARNTFNNTIDDIDTFTVNAKDKLDLVEKKLGDRGKMLVKLLRDILADIRKESLNKLAKQLVDVDSKRIAKQLSLDKEGYSERLKLLENYTAEYLKESKKVLDAQVGIDKEKLRQRYLSGEFGEVKEDRTEKYKAKRDKVKVDYASGDIGEDFYNQYVANLNKVYKAEAEWYNLLTLLYENYMQDLWQTERNAKERQLKITEQLNQNELTRLATTYEAKLDLLYGYYDNMSEADKQYWAEQMARGQFNIDEYWKMLKDNGGFGSDEYWNNLKERIGTHEGEILQLEYNAAVTELENIRTLGKQKGESIEEYQGRELAAVQKVQAVHTKANETIEKSDETRYQATQTVIGGLITLTEEMGKEDKEAAKLAKALALFNIMVNTAEAIAKMTSRESGKGIIGIATTAAGIASILANMASAMSLLKQAKFAKGAVNIGGAGSATSDSIPARISRGESVMNAKATKMFEPILIAMNNIGNGVALPRNNYVQTQQTADMTEAFTTAAERIRPVVDVREITSTQNRVEVLQNLDTY